MTVDNFSFHMMIAKVVLIAMPVLIVMGVVAWTLYMFDFKIYKPLFHLILALSLLLGLPITYTLLNVGKLTSPEGQITMQLFINRNQEVEARSLAQSVKLPNEIWMRFSTSGVPDGVKDRLKELGIIVYDMDEKDVTPRSQENSSNHILVEVALEAFADYRTKRRFIWREFREVENTLITYIIEATLNIFKGPEKIGSGFRRFRQWPDEDLEDLYVNNAPLANAVIIALAEALNKP